MFFVQKVQAVDREVRRKMVEPANLDLSIGKQCRLLSISRSSFYYTPKGGTAITCGSRTPMPEALRPNARWSLDFLADSFGASRKFRILTAIDDCCRENLCQMADTSISGARVPRELDALVWVYGKPGCIVRDNVLCAE